MCKFHFEKLCFLSHSVFLSLSLQSVNYLELLYSWLCPVAQQQASVLELHPSGLASGTTTCLSLEKLFLLPCTQAMGEVGCQSASVWITLLVLLEWKFWRYEKSLIGWYALVGFSLLMVLVGMWRSNSY